MNETEQTEDVLNMAILFCTALNKSLTSKNINRDVADVAQCLSDWADSLETGGGIDMTAAHWTHMIGALQ